MSDTLRRVTFDDALACRGNCLSTENPPSPTVVCGSTPSASHCLNVVDLSAHYACQTGAVFIEDLDRLQVQTGRIKHLDKNGFLGTDFFAEGPLVSECLRKVQKHRSPTQLRPDLGIVCENLGGVSVPRLLLENVEV